MSLPLPPSRRRARPGLIAAAAAAAVAAAAVVAAVVILYRPASGQAPGPPPPRPSLQEGRVPARAPGSAAPVTVSTAGWYAVALDGTAVPASPQDGPRRGPWPLATGYADDPAGAVLAAVGIAVRTSGQLGPDVFSPTIARQVTGPGARAMLAAAWLDYAQASGQHPPPGPGSPAGTATASARAFRLASFTPAAAAVQVLAVAGASQAVIQVQVRWLDGDWRLVSPPGGNLAAAAVRPSGPAGFQLLPGR